MDLSQKTDYGWNWKVWVHWKARTSILQKLAILQLWTVFLLSCAGTRPGRAGTEMLPRALACCRAAGISSIFIVNVLIMHITKEFKVPRSRQDV
jgi:hypothetical protein